MVQLVTLIANRVLEAYTLSKTELPRSWKTMAMGAAKKRLFMEFNHREHIWQTFLDRKSSNGTMLRRQQRCHLDLLHTQVTINGWEDWA